MVRLKYPDLVTSSDPGWDELEKILKTVIEEIEIKKINGTAKDALDYDDSPLPVKVIAIGGDKLSRGLTLEGLTVSYFLRASECTTR